MSPDTHTVIVGGGLIGVTTAWELVQRGGRVTVIEAESDLASQASFANGGLLTASMSDPWNSPGVASHLFRSFFDPGAAIKLRLKAIPSLTVWGLQFLGSSTARRHAQTTRHNFVLSDFSVRETVKLGEELAIKFSSSNSGALKIFGSKKAAEGPLALSESLREYGSCHEYLEVDEVIAMDPQLEHAKDKIACGMFYKNDASGDARAFTRSLGHHAEKAGVEFKTGCRVNKICTSSGRITAVATTQGQFSADNVVIAAGATSPVLAKPLGVTVPVKPAKGYSVTLDMANWSSRPSLPIIDDAMHAGFIPLADQLRLAGTAEFASFDKRLRQERVDNLLTLFGRLYPRLATQIDRTQAKPWTDFRPMSATGRPIVGPCGPKGLWLNTGHGHLGWTMAVGSAKLLAAQMFNEPIAIDQAPFQLG